MLQRSGLAGFCPRLFAHRAPNLKRCQGLHFARLKGSHIRGAKPLIFAPVEQRERLQLRFNRKRWRAKPREFVHISARNRRDLRKSIC
jgi:hypothetical protein